MRNYTDSVRSKGFTIVELLIVIVVIGILAAITLVAYNGVQERARETTLQADLRSAATKMELAKVESGVYPTSADDLPKTEGTNYQITASDEEYCLTATATGADPYRVASGGTVSEGPCPGHEFGYAAPAGVNVAAPITQWARSGPAAVSGGVLQLPLHSSGTEPRAASGFVRVDEAKSMVATFEMRSMVAGARPVFGTRYYAADQSTLVANTSNYTSNGHAPSVTSVGAWESRSAGFALGPGIYYATIDVRTAGSYNGPVEIRNLEVKLTR